MAPAVSEFPCYGCATGLNSISFRKGMPPALFPTFVDGRVVHQIKIEYQHSTMDIFIALGLKAIIIVSTLGPVIESASRVNIHA
jgi:hypothetical protein